MAEAKEVSGRGAKGAIWVGLLGIIILGGYVFAQAEENAAVLYRKAFELYSEPSKEIKAQLSKYMSGDIELNEEIKSHIEKNRQIIQLVIEASRLKHCDWEFDNTKNMQYLEDCLEVSSAAKKISQLLWSDCRIQIDNSNFRNAIDRCKSVYRLSGHIADRVLITWLVYTALGSITNDMIAEILPEIQEDKNLLTTVKYELWRFSKKDESFFAFDSETEWMAGHINNNEIKNKLKTLFGQDPNTIEDYDEIFLAKCKECFREQRSEIKRTFKMPYLHAREARKAIREKYFTDFNLETPYNQKQADTKHLRKDLLNNPAFRALIIDHSLIEIYNLRVKCKTEVNAFRTAVELYLIRARTGKLPDSLPAGSAKDLFSGKDFIYEKTEDGFVLKCQGKDLEKDEIYEYEFKVKK